MDYVWLRMVNMGEGHQAYVTTPLFFCYIAPLPNIRYLLIITLIFVRRNCSPAALTPVAPFVNMA